MIDATLGEGGGFFGADGRLAESRPCLGCRYELRGMRAEDVCPECGRAVRASLIGPMLVNADAGWLRRVHGGAWLAVGGLMLVLLAILLAAGAAVVRELGDAVWSPGTVDLVALERAITLPAGTALILAPVATAAGWWMLASPDPALGRTDPHRRHGRWVRRMIVAVGVGIVAGLAVELAAKSWLERWSWYRLSGSAPAALVTLAVGLWMVHAGAMVRRASLRVPDFVQRRRCTRVAVLGAALAALTVPMVAARVAEVLADSGRARWLRDGVEILEGVSGLLALIVVLWGVIAYTWMTVMWWSILGKARASGAQAGGAGAGGAA